MNDGAAHGQETGSRAPQVGPAGGAGPHHAGSATATVSSAARAPLALVLCWLVVTACWWALALAPVADPPPWLLAARSACFGSTASGLPDAGGWLMLAAAPATFLVAIVVTWSVELGSALRSLAARGAGRAALAAVALFVVTGSAAAAVRIADGLAVENIEFGPLAAGPLPEAYPRLGAEVPPLDLVDQQLRPFTNDHLRGRVTLVTFAFAHCQTICPAIVQTLRTLATKMGSESPDIVVVTLDPWRDTPARLASMHEDWAMPPSARVLSGDVDDVTAALDGFNVPWSRDEATGDVTHPALIYAIGRDGRIAYGFNNPTVDWLVDASRRLEADREVAGG